MNIGSIGLKLFLVRLVNTGLIFLATVYFARYLGAELLGVYFLFEAAIGIFALVSDFGLRGALEKRLSENQPEDKIIGTSVLIKCIFLVILLAIISVYSSSIDNYIGYSVTLFVMYGLVVHEVYHTQIYILRGQLDVELTVYLELGKQFMWFISSLLLLEFGLGIESLFISYCFSRTVMSIPPVLFINTSISSPNKKYTRSLFHYAKYNVVSEVNWKLHSWLDVLIIGLFLTQTSVGAYEVAWRVSEVVTLATGAIGAVLFPQVSYWHSQNEYKKIEKTVKKYTTTSLYLVIPASVGGSILSFEILLYIFGKEFSIADQVLVILLIQKVSHGYYIIYSRTLSAVDRPDLAARAKIISLGLNILLNVGLIIKLGLIGAAIATTTSFIINTLIIYYYLSTELEVSVNHSEIGWISISSILMGVAVLTLKYVYKIDSSITLIIYVFIGGVLYLCISLLHTGIRENIRSLFSRL